MEETQYTNLKFDEINGSDQQSKGTNIFGTLNIFLVFGK